MLKQISFAYPSSTLAVGLGYGSSGCYVVETLETLETLDARRKTSSAHNSLQDAIAAADAINCPWSPLYRAHPMPGHELS